MVDGIGDPHKWLYVWSDRGSYIFFTGLTELHPVNTSWTLKSNVKYTYRSLRFPNCKEGAMFMEVLLYACNVGCGTFDSVQTEDVKHVVPKSETLDWDDFVRDIRMHFLESEQVDRIEGYLADRRCWTHSFAYHFLLEIAGKYTHIGISKSWLEGEIDPALRVPWWIREPLMAKRREYVRDIMEHQRIDRPIVKQLGHFSAQPEIFLPLEKPDDSE